MYINAPTARPLTCLASHPGKSVWAAVAVSWRGPPLSMAGTDPGSKLIRRVRGSGSTPEQAERPIRSLPRGGFGEVDCPNRPSFQL